MRFLRSKGLFPEDTGDDDSDEMVKGRLMNRWVGGN